MAGMALDGIAPAAEPTMLDAVEQPAVPATQVNVPVVEQVETAAIDLVADAMGQVAALNEAAVEPAQPVASQNTVPGSGLQVEPTATAAAVPGTATAVSPAVAFARYLAESAQ